MGVITALEIQTRNKERVNIYLDGTYAFSLALMQAARLKKGQSLSQSEIDELRAADEIDKAVDRAMRFLAQRPRSTAEVRRNLQRKQVATQVIELAIQRLEAMGYLDDEAFARYWLENRDTFKPRGPMAIRYELRQKGVADSIVDRVLEALDATDAAYRAASKRARRLRGSTQQEFEKKLGSFLQRRGFNYATCREVIEQVAAEIQREDADFFAPDDDDLYDY